MENGTLDVALFTFNEIYENQIIVLNVNIFYRKIYIQLDFHIRWMQSLGIWFNWIYMAARLQHTFDLLSHFVDVALCDMFEWNSVYGRGFIELIHDTKWTKKGHQSWVKSSAMQWIVLFITIDFFDLFNAIALSAQGKFHSTMDSPNRSSFQKQKIRCLFDKCKRFQMQFVVSKINTLINFNNLTFLWICELANMNAI